jgi:hypothetical protein
MAKFVVTTVGMGIEHALRILPWNSVDQSFNIYIVVLSPGHGTWMSIGLKGFYATELKYDPFPLRGGMIAVL